MKQMAVLIPLNMMFAIFSLVTFCSGQSGYDVKTVVTKPFKENDYYTNVRPNLIQTLPIVVTMDLYILSVGGIDKYPKS